MNEEMGDLHNTIIVGCESQPSNTLNINPASNTFLQTLNFRVENIGDRGVEVAWDGGEEKEEEEEEDDDEENQKNTVVSNNFNVLALFEFIKSLKYSNLSNNSFLFQNYQILKDGQKYGPEFSRRTCHMWVKDVSAGQEVSLQLVVSLSTSMFLGNHFEKNIVLISLFDTRSFKKIIKKPN